MNYLISIALAFISALATAYTTFYFTRKSNRALNMQRLEKVYFPLYVLLEDYFYQFDKFEYPKFIPLIKRIIEENRLLAGNFLYSSFEDLCKDWDEKQYKRFCDIVLFEYNELLRSVGLPTLSFHFRMKHKMYRKRNYFYKISSFLKVGIGLIFILFFSFLFAILLFTRYHQ